MLYIITEKDCEHNFLCNRLDDYQIAWRREPNAGVWIVVDHSTKHLNVLTKIMVEMFLVLTIKENLIDRIQHDYYYQNPIEINQIASVAIDIVCTDQFESVTFIYDLKETVLSHFKMVPTGVYDYNARVASFLETSDWILDELIGRAIDEKKQEEQYQELLESLRQYTKFVDSKVDELHVVQGDTFRFFLSDGERLRSKQLQEAIMKASILPTGFDETELNITPILALAPKKIYVYLNDPFDKKIVAVQNIFEEKVELRELNQFPFNSF